MGNLLLDASAVVRIIQEAEQSGSFQEAVLNADQVLAPELMVTEMVNVIWRLQWVGQLAADAISTISEQIVLRENNGAHCRSTN